MTEHPDAYLVSHGIVPVSQRAVNVMSHTAEFQAWGDAIEAGLQHRDGCPECQPPRAADDLCAAGQALREAEMAAHAAWRALGEGGRRV